jgi:hypothetical protein
MQNSKERALKLRAVHISSRGQLRVRPEYFFIRLSIFVARLLEIMMGRIADVSFGSRVLT